MGTLLRDVLTRVADSEGEPPRRVVLTHPANWGPFRRALFEEVAAFAGSPDPACWVGTEPEAAARATRPAGTWRPGRPSPSTTSARDLRRHRAARHPRWRGDPGDPEGVERLGGSTSTRRSSGTSASTATARWTELDLRDQQVAIALSGCGRTACWPRRRSRWTPRPSIPVFLPGRHFDVSLTRSDFEDLVRAQIDSTVGALARTLRSARVEPAELSAVLLVGGPRASRWSPKWCRPSWPPHRGGHASQVRGGTGRRHAGHPRPRRGGQAVGAAADSRPRPGALRTATERAGRRTEGPGAPAHLAAAARPALSRAAAIPRAAALADPLRHRAARPVRADPAGPPLPPPVPLPAPAAPRHRPLHPAHRARTTAPGGNPTRRRSASRRQAPRPARAGGRRGGGDALALAAAGYVLLRASASAAVGPANWR